ncbi:hypothetical protein GGS20DRAFT_588593 [Poronia punctata]|nr:hypothetical protein GGS20DRAFT_588593 [Poronia punctata]
MTIQDDLAFLQRYEREETRAISLEYATRQLRDPDMPIRAAAGFGKFRYNESGLCYGPGHKPRESTAVIPQFRLYGVPYKTGEDPKRAAARALEEGMFVQPQPKLAALEKRLASQFRNIKQRHVGLLKDYYELKRTREQATRKRSVYMSIM